VTASIQPRRGSPNNNQGAMARSRRFTENSGRLTLFMPHLFLAHSALKYRAAGSRPEPIYSREITSLRK
jgi:hypothetical protein